ncbi:MAG: hypothetical protein ACIAQF_13125 [Phycisphaerales bacterium JB065]
MNTFHHKDPQRPSAHRRWRSGVISAELAVTLVAASVITAASFFLVPMAVRGMMLPSLPEDRSPDNDTRRIAFDALRLLLRSCKEVVAVHTNEDAGVTEVVLWHRDVDLDSQIDPSEIVLLTHSRFLGQISAASQGWQPDRDDDDFERLTMPIERALASSVQFSSKWRSRPDVETVPVAVGIDSFRLEDLSRNFEQGTYRVVLRWSPNVSDAVEDEVSWFHIGPGAE